MTFCLYFSRQVFTHLTDQIRFEDMPEIQKKLHAQKMWHVKRIYTHLLKLQVLHWSKSVEFFSKTFISQDISAIALTLGIWWLSAVFTLLISTTVRIEMSFDFGVRWQDSRGYRNKDIFNEFHDAGVIREDLHICVFLHGYIKCIQ